MPVTGALERYWVKPGTKLDLSKIDSDDKSLFQGGGREQFDPQFEELQRQLQELQKRLYAQNKHRILVVIQAMDTGGKDGCIKHVFSRIDPQGINVTAFKKPSADELAHDFLWRVHSKIPGNGQIVIFNRSHYEDVIAVRVKKIYPETVWKNRQRHIIEFERMLAEEGTTIVKIFLHISKEEQKKRLQSRIDDPMKHWKIHPDDLSDRARWSEFMVAYEELLSKTSTDTAPWYVVPSNRKWYRNLCVARIMVDTMNKLNLEYPTIWWDPTTLQIED